MEDKSSLQPPLISKKPIGISKAIFLGHLVVNIPALILLLTFMFGGIIPAFLLSAQFTSFWVGVIVWVSGWIILSIIGILIAWTLWSYSVPRWRKWALQKGATEEELQKWGVITGLLWPKGSAFEKTEFKLKE
jgi:hypothetical protein